MSKIARIDHERVEKDRADHRAGSSKFFKFKEGNNYVRILPPVEGRVDEGTFYGRHRQHGIKMDGGFRSIRCLEDHGKWCPFCAMAHFFHKRPGEDNSKRARACFNNTRYYLNAITGEVRVTRDKRRVLRPNEETGIVILQISSSLFDKCYEHFTGEWGDFTDPTKGYWLNITAKGEGNSRRYPMVTPSQMNMGKLPSWVDLEDAHDLTSAEMLQDKSASEMVMMLVDRYGDLFEVEDILRSTRKQRKKGKRNGDD